MGPHHWEASAVATPYILTSIYLLIIDYVPDTVTGARDGIWSNVDKISALFKLKTLWGRKTSKSFQSY